MPDDNKKIGWIIAYRGDWKQLYPHDDDYVQEKLKDPKNVLDKEEITKNLDKERQVFEAVEYLLYTDVIRRNRFVAFMERGQYYVWRITAVEIDRCD